MKCFIPLIAEIDWGLAAGLAVLFCCIAAFSYIAVYVLVRVVIDLWKR